MAQLRTCGVEDDPDALIPDDTPTTQDAHLRGNVTVDLHTYRLALATTVEYSLQNGNNVTSIMNAVTNVLNKVNGILEKEVAIRLVLIANTSNTFFIGAPNSDPYTNGNSGIMIGENPGALNLAYGAGAYDIGHVFGIAPSGGVVGTAQLSSVCGGVTIKGRGASNVLVPSTFYQTVIHEIGHQFSALHNFNFCDGQNETPPGDYEPGGGSTIMCYTGAGVCGGNSVQNDPDDYFHINALERIRSFSRDPGSGGSCNQVVSEGNNAPEVSIPLTNGFTIPKSTPFELTGSAIDADGDAMTYVWEQYDRGPASPLGTPIGTAPMFRSVIPGNSPTRVFPRIQSIINNTSQITEVLPTTTRVITFRLTARDNKAPAGAYGYKEVQFNSTANAGPFLVTKPNTAGVTWSVGEFVEVTWNVANTNLAPVNCQNVNIRLSKDGGLTYPVMLLAGTPNDGSASFTVPDEVTNNARVRVEAADNIFFDISNASFSIISPNQPNFTLVTSPETGQVCLPGTFEIDINTGSLLGFNEPISFAVSGLPTGATASFSANPVNPGQNTTLNIDLTNVTEGGQHGITITASASGVPDAQRSVALDVVSSDFSALKLILPVDGSSGQSALPTFEWTPLPNALTYDIEIATSAAFGASVVNQASGLTGSSYTPSITLDDNKPYYWRIRPSNACGSGAFSDAASFHTVAQVCSPLQSTDGPFPIPSTGLPLIKSEINVSSSGTISDVNVLKVQGNHDAVGDLEFRLRGPDNTAVVLLSKPPCNSPQFNLGFDDESPNATPPCPPNNGFLYRPKGKLSDLDGKNSQGKWTLELEVVNTLGNGGTFQGWSMEFCAALQPNNPFLVTNDTLTVPPSGNRLIYINKLLVSDIDNAPHELKFTIVSNTKHGTVSLDGNALGVGGQFTMQDIYSSRVRYTNTNPDAMNDYFTFSVSDGVGGWFGTPRFNLKINVNADPTGTEDLKNADHILLYPNPATSLVTVEFLEKTAGAVAVRLVNGQGQLVFERKLAAGSCKLQLNTGGLPAGLYHVFIATQEGVFVKKLIVGR
jgi:subtilisin-like proprotein convertase family protein